MKNSSAPTRLLPYEDLTISQVSEKEYQFTTPWLSVRSTIDASDDVQSTLKAFERREYASVNVEILSSVLAQLNLPFFYLLPNENPEAQKDVHRLPAETQNLANVQSKNEFRNLLGLGPSRTEDQEWAWDEEAILSFSQLTPTTFSPASILSVVRRFHLLDCVERDQTTNLYHFCRSLKGSSADLSWMLATIVYQNYYVTHKCQESLEPALELSASSAKALEEFMSDEEGHDLLLMRALTSMGPAVKDLYLASSTENIMRVLKLSGSLNFLSFCLAVDFFEKPNFGAEDPLAVLLTEFQYDIAATCLQKHKDINDGGEHECIAIDLLASMKPVQKDYAVVAIRLAEVLSDEMTSVTNELLNLFSNKKLTKQA